MWKTSLVKDNDFGKTRYVEHAFVVKFPSPVSATLKAIYVDNFPWIELTFNGGLSLPNPHVRSENPRLTA